MISHNDLLAIKERLFVAAQAARAMVEAADPTVVRYDETEYWRVHIALAHLHHDVSAVLAELDTLRGMFVEKVNEFFNCEGFTNEIPVSGNAVAGVPNTLNVGSGGEARHDEAVPSEPAPAGRVRRRRAKSAKPRGDSAGVPVASEGVDPGTAAAEMGGQQES